MRKILSSAGRFLIWVIKVVVLVASSWALAIVAAGFAVRAFSTMDIFSVRQFIGVFSIWNITDSTFPISVLAIMWSTAAFMFISSLLFLRFAHAIDLEGAVGRVLRTLWQSRPRRREEPLMEPDESDDSDSAPSREATAGASPQDEQTEDPAALPSSSRGTPRRRRTAELDEVEPHADRVHPAEQDANTDDSDDGQELAQEDGDDWRSPPPITVLNKKAMLMMAIRDPLRFIRSLVRGVTYDEQPDDTVAAVAHMARLKPNRLRQAMRKPVEEVVDDASMAVEAEANAEAEAEAAVQMLVERIKSLVGQYLMGREFRSPELLQTMLEVAAARDEAVDAALVDAVGSARATEMLAVLDAVVEQLRGRAPQARVRGSGRASAGAGEGEVDETAEAEREALGGAGVGAGVGGPAGTAAGHGEHDQEDEVQVRPEFSKGRRVRSLDEDEQGVAVEADPVALTRSAQRVGAGDDGLDDDLGQGQSAAVESPREKPLAAKPAVVASSKPVPALVAAAVGSDAAAPKDAVPSDVDRELASMAEVKSLQETIANAGLNSELLNQLSSEVEVLGMDQRVADYLIYGERRPGPLPLVTCWALAQLAEMVGEKQSAMAAALTKGLAAHGSGSPADRGYNAATNGALPSAADSAPEVVPAASASAVAGSNSEDDGMDETLDETVSETPATERVRTSGQAARQADGVAVRAIAPTVPLAALASPAPAVSGEGRPEQRVNGPAAETAAGGMEVEAMSEKMPVRPVSAGAVGRPAEAASAARLDETGRARAAAKPAAEGAVDFRRQGDERRAPDINHVMRDMQVRRLSHVTSWLEDMARHVERCERQDPDYDPEITGPILLNSRKSKVRIIRDALDFAPDAFTAWRAQVEQLMSEHCTMLDSLIAEAMEMPIAAGAGSVVSRAEGAALPAASEVKESNSAAASDSAVKPAEQASGLSAAAGDRVVDAAAVKPVTAKAGDDVDGGTSTLTVARASQPADLGAPVAEPTGERKADGSIEAGGAMSAEAAGEAKPSAAAASGPVMAPAPAAVPAVQAQSPAAPVVVLASAAEGAGPGVPASATAGAVDLAALMSFMSRTIEMVQKGSSQTLELVQRNNAEAMQTLAREVREAARSYGVQPPAAPNPGASAAVVVQGGPGAPDAEAKVDAADAGERGSNDDVAGESADEANAEREQVAAVSAPAATEESVSAAAAPAAETGGHGSEEVLRVDAAAGRRLRRAEIEHQLEAVLVENRFKVRTQQYLFADQPKFVVGIDVMATRLSGDRKTVMFVVVDEPDTHWLSARVEMRVGGQGMIVEPVADLVGEDARGGSVKHTTPLMLRPLARKRYCAEMGIDPAAADDRLMICVLVVCRDGEPVLTELDSAAVAAKDFDVLGVTPEALGKCVDHFVRRFADGITKAVVAA